MSVLDKFKIIDWKAYEEKITIDEWEDCEFKR